MASPSNEASSISSSNEASTSHSERNSSILTRSIPDFLQFKKRRIHGEQTVRTLMPQHLIKDENCQHNLTTEENLTKIRRFHKHYAKNEIRTTKYTILSFIPKNLFEQFHRFANCYFVFIILLNFIPEIGAIEPFLSMVPVIVILLVQAIKDLVEDYGRYKNDSEVNSAETEVHLSNDNKYHTVKWSELQVGDMVRVVCNTVIPADVLLLHSSDVDGRCFIETSNIDGESNLKQRTVVKRHWGLQHPNEFRPTDFKSIIECQTPNNEIYKFHGNIIPPDNGDKISINNSNLLLRGCVIRNTDYVEGIVIYAGHETKAMLNNNGPRHKRSKLERRMNTDVIYCVVLLIVMCLLGAIGNGVWASTQNSINQTELYIPREKGGETLDAALSGFYMFWTMVILLQVLIPISLYVSIELVKWFQVYMINNDLDLYHEESDTPMKCRALNITEDLGQIQYVFSDKTGTLTENQMVFRRCTVGGVDYPHAANAARIENLEPTPADINPIHLSKHGESFPAREETSRQSYRRPASGSVKPHHRRNLSTVSKHHEDWDTEEEGRIFRQMTSRSAPNSPGMSRKHAASIRRPAAHHRRNISSVSAKEVQASLSQEQQQQVEPEDPYLEPPVNEDLETDVTPDPVLFRQLQSIPNPMQHTGDNNVKLTVKKERILDFFINLAICNTVVLSTDVEESRVAIERKTPKPKSPTKQSPSSITESIPQLLRNISQKLSSSSDEKYTNMASTHSTPETSHPERGAREKTVHFESANTDDSADDVSAQRRFTTEELSKIRYEAESPDEAALVYAAHAYGCVLAHRSSTGGKESVTLTLPQGEGTMVFEVLHKLPFDSARKRMSVIVRDPKTGQVTLYCKGADSAILSQLAEPSSDVHFSLSAESGGQDIAKKSSNDQEVVAMTKKYLGAYARTGLRTLCISKRTLSDVEYKDWLEEYMVANLSLENREQLVMNTIYKMETDLELLGATGIEDRLQEGVPETIESLRQAGIQVWVVTGDKQETAINIGYSCRLIHQMDEVIILNAETKEALAQLLDIHIKEQDDKRGILPDYDQTPSTILNSFNISFILPNAPNFPTIDDKDHKALVLIIDGKTLAFALQKDLQKRFVQLARRCRSVLCCRATPLQKGEVVKLIRDELKVMTLAIGDGANDVSMIQVADVGIGLSGQEGMQAVMSSDYALAQFRFLRKLLLVHGHWNYARLASMVLYFFYKNAAFVFLIFWYQIFCGFSGGNMIEQWYLLLFNLVFTSVPPLINGVLDKDLREETLLRKPSLYRQGITDELYLKRSFWINIFDAIYQSVIIFFFIYLAYKDSDVGMIEWGTVVTSASVFVILLHLGIETKTWTWIHWLCQILSVLVFFAFALIYNIICPACSPPSNPYFIMERVIQTGNFWFSILLVTVVALFPRYTVRAIQSNLYPTECQKERVLERIRTEKSSSTVSTSLIGSSTTSSSSTYQNPTFRHHAPAAFVSPSTPNVPPQRPSALEYGQEAGRDSHFLHYGGSTPDLSTTSPYYSSHNANNSNNRSGPDPQLVHPDGNSAFVNEGYHRSPYYDLHDGSDYDMESDTGEQRTRRRLSMRCAVGEVDPPAYEKANTLPHPLNSSLNTANRTTLTSPVDVGDVDMPSSNTDHTPSKTSAYVSNIPV